MVESLQAMTAQQLKRDKKKDKKLSMPLVSLLRLWGCSTQCPQKLRDSSPKMPSFTKKVMEDRDSNRALGEDSRKDGQDGSAKRIPIIPVERIRSGRYQ
jgi:uncharacterized lipoprotein YajG